MEPPVGPLSPGQRREALVAAVRADLGHLGVGGAAVVACSGGPDSTALAYLVAEARPDLALTLGHVRHGLRDDAADLAVVEQHADWLGVDLEVRAVEVVRRGEGTAAAARTARYRALREIAAAVGAGVVLVGHTADDQAETVLLRLARGTGTDGLRAMAAVRGGVARPLLRLRRSDLRRYLDLEGLPSVEDPSNVDPRSPRAVVRHEVLPRLSSVAPDVVGALARVAAIARDDVETLEAAAAALLASARRVGPVVSLPEVELAAAPRALARRVVRAVVTEATGRPPSAETLAVALSARGGSLAGGLEVAVAGGWRSFAPPGPLDAPEAALRVPGTTPWPSAGVALHVLAADRGQGEQDVPAVDEGTPDGQVALPLPGVWVPPRVHAPAALTPPGGHRDRLVVHLPAGLGPLTVRSRRPGDRIRLRVGTARLADVLIDAGVPRAVRARWPLVVAGDRLVWVPGVAADAEALAAGAADPALVVVVRRARGGGAASQ